MEFHDILISAMCDRLSKETFADSSTTISSIDYEIPDYPYPLAVGHIGENVQIQETRWLILGLSDPGNIYVIVHQFCPDGFPTALLTWHQLIQKTVDH